MSAHKPEDALSQNQSCVTDELTAVDSSVQNQEEEEEDREQKETHSDAHPCDPLGAEAVVSDGTGSTSSDESDSEHFSGGGYTLLPQELGDEKQSDWTASDGGCSAHEEDVVNTRTGGADTGPVGAVSQLEESQVQAIKQAMSGFSLPVSAVPQWAKVVPEDVWKAELIGGLRTKPKSR